MSTHDHLQIAYDEREDRACPDCGAFLDGWVRESDLENLHAQNRRLLARVRHLEHEQAQQILNDPLYPEVVEVLEFWQERCAPKAKEPLSTNRAEVVLARLKGGYTKDELMMAILGYASKPYWTRSGRQRQGKPSQRRVEARTMFCEARYVDAGLALAQEAQQEGLQALTPGERIQLRMTLL